VLRGRQIIPQVFSSIIVVRIAEPQVAVRWT
jgi:hypothetical protein